MVKENSFFIQLAELVLIEHLIKEYYSDEKPDVLALMEEIKRNVDTWLKTSDFPQDPQASRRSESSTYPITKRKRWNTRSFARSMRSKEFPKSGPSAFEHYILRHLSTHQPLEPWNSFYVESRQNELLSAMLILHEMSMTLKKPARSELIKEIQQHHSQGFRKRNGTTLGFYLG